MISVQQQILNNRKTLAEQKISLTDEIHNRRETGDEIEGEKLCNKLKTFIPTTLLPYNTRVRLCMYHVVVSIVVDIHLPSQYPIL